MTQKPTTTIFPKRINGDNFRAFVKDIVNGKRVTIFTTEEVDNPATALKIAYQWAREKGLEVR